MKKYKLIIIFVNLILLLVYFNYAVMKKENLFSGDGQLVLLELAPVDPRSLMQGDYMSLRYSIAQEIPSDIPMKGYCVVVIDSQGVAQRIRFQKNITPLNTGEYLIEYQSHNNWRIVIGAESFFFQEGTAEKYEKAKYGGLKINKNGNSILVGLYDEQRHKIE